MKNIFILLIRFYQVFISPFLGKNCRFYPSCSEYTKECFEKFPAHRAFTLSAKRICKCHPFSEGGLDPVPDDTSKNSNKEDESNA
ncbi:membrane protein insertion efficiency factor YidD [Bacteriovorax sp. DB6_IX]|uniref:membrane protein insertion efficiency factor YidD n=1 Tax=Bacteriovorax sp. DB6_IX TaxID=1353530 RepID=UPI00038A318B|nr:membrane protein insertion efficiency factor YidD [Bacteriovorax sp. DB6_IX]EQC48732.1 putative membrane protein insertion efficiency factor [Bacteriovorax sp. DB6_IX]